MTGMWLVCLSLLVAADAASIANKPVDIPVQVVYDNPQVRQLASLNLEAKPQLSEIQQVQAEELHIPEVIAKIALPQDEDSSSQSVESSEEKIKYESSNENKSGENSSEEDSNEVDNNSLENIKLKLVNPEQAAEFEVAEVAPISVQEAVILEADAPKVQEVVPLVEEIIPEVQEIVPVAQEFVPVAQEIIPVVQEIVPITQEIVPIVQEIAPLVQDVQLEQEVPIVQDVPVVQEEIVPAEEVGEQQVKVKFIPVEEQDSTFLKQANATTPYPNRPILGFINRLGETVGNALNSFRPPNAAPSAQPAVAPAQGNAANQPLVSESGLPIAAATEEEPVPAAVAPEAPAASPSPATPTLINNLQHNINNQLNTFGNRVNSFINNLRPKQPEGSQGDEEPVTPNTPVINGIQTNFNQGLSGFTNTVNNAFGFFGQNPDLQNFTQSDDTTQPQNNNPIIQTILNGASNFQQSFTSFIGGQNPNQQGDEASPVNATNNNIGSQVLQVFQNGISNIVQSFRPGGNNGSQSDENSPSPATNPIASGFQNILGNFGSQWNNFFGGAQQNNSLTQGIPSQLPNPGNLVGSGPFQNFTSNLPQIPGVDQFQNITSNLPQIPGVDQFQNFTNQGAQTFQNFTSQFPGAAAGPFQNFSLPGASAFPSGPTIPGIGNLPELPGIGNVPELPAIGNLPGLPTLGNIPGISSIPSIPGIVSNNPAEPIPVALAPAQPAPVSETL